MESAILNLAINARDAMPKGGALTIETRNVTLDQDYASLNPDVTPGDYVQIAVSDSGTGMSPEVLNHVFDPFFTTKEVGKGSGLGLSMVYGFVKQSSGHIKIYSEVDQGTSIRIYLPRVDGDSAAATIENEVAIKDTRGSETILVTEDAESVRDYVTQQLESLGYTVIEASDAEEALSILEGRNDIDLLFTDVVLPGGINGRQLAEIALNKYPALKVLYTTGYTENAVVHHGKLDAGVELLSKPYRREDLARHVRIVLDKP
jgi:CheY-like chemotaxis protein